MPKTGIAKVLETVKGKYQEWQDMVRKIPWIWGAIAWLNDFGIGKLKREGEMLSGTVRWAVKLAELPWRAADYVSGKMTGQDESAKTRQQMGNPLSERMKNLDRSVWLNPDSMSASIGEQVVPMIAGSGVAWATSKLLSQFPKLAGLAKTSPYLSRTLTGASGNAAFEATREVASWEKISPTSIGLSAALSPAFEWASKAYWMVAKSKVGQQFMEKMAVTNLLDKTWLKNILAKVAKGGDDLMWPVDENQIDDLASEWARLISGKEVKLGDDMVSTVVSKIQQRIKPWNVKSQVTQLDNLATEIKWGIDKSLSSIKKPEPSPFAKKLLGAVEDFESKYSPASITDLSKFKDIKGRWRTNYTATELNEIKQLSDKTLKMYWASWNTLQNASEVASYRGALKQQIEKMAESVWIKDIASRNAEVALYKWLAESAKAASYGKRLWTLMNNNKLGAGISLAWIVGTSYGISKMTDIPQMVTLPATAAIAFLWTKIGLSNTITTKLARNIYEKAGKDSIVWWQKYIKTGEPQYKRTAEKVIRMIMWEIKALTSKDA